MSKLRLVVDAAELAKARRELDEMKKLGVRRAITLESVVELVARVIRVVETKR